MKPAPISFKGSVYSNPNILKALKYASEKPAIVEAAAILGLSTIVRPITIMNTPKTDKREKEYIASKSVVSGILSFALTSLIFKPFSKAVENIEKSPSEFLTRDTISALTNTGKTLSASKPFNYMKQTIKYTPQFLSIVPKALLTTVLITPVLEFLFGRNKNRNENIDNIHSKENNNTQSTPSFKGIHPENLVSEIMNNKNFQKIAVKNQNSNLFFNIISVKDIISTGVFALLTNKNKKIEEKNKKPLIINSVLSTGFAVLGGYLTDKITNKPFEKFLDKLSRANVNDANLPKYIEGAKVLKPIIILGTIYYGIIPPLSTFISGKLSHIKEDKNEKA